MENKDELKSIKQSLEQALKAVNRIIGELEEVEIVEIKSYKNDWDKNPLLETNSERLDDMSLEGLNNLNR